MRLEIVEVSRAAQLCSGQELSRWLSDSERAMYGRFPVPKRRREWLAGRIAAKKLACRELARLGFKTDKSKIGVNYSVSGRPLLLFQKIAQINPDFSLALPQWCLTLGHAGSWAAAALHETGLVGLDLEIIEHRTSAWLETAFHPIERTPELKASPYLQTEAWTVKEAVLKLLGIGFKADIWDVRCYLADGGGWYVRMSGLAGERYGEIGRPALHLSSRLISANTILTFAFTQVETMKDVKCET